MNPGQAQLMSMQGHFMPSPAAIMQLIPGVTYYVGAYEEIYVRYFEPGIRDGPAGRFHAEILDFFVADDMPRPDARAGGYPLVAGVEKRGQLIVRNYFLGKRAPCTYYIHKIKDLIPGAKVVQKTEKQKVEANKLTDNR